MMPFYSGLALVGGLFVLSMGLRTLSHPLFHKLAILCLIAVSFLIGWLPTGSVPAGVFCATLWLLLPWLELLTRVRHLRLPVEKELEDTRPPSRELFPDLDELTEEIEAAQFQHLEDVGWEWESQNQFFRLFYRESEKLQAAICSVDQDHVVFFYLSLSTRTKDGSLWTTWNYPFATALKKTPHVHLNRVPSMTDFPSMIEQHQLFLAKNLVPQSEIVLLDAESTRAAMQGDLRAQIEHNVRAGVLLPSDEGKVRYSWRGLFFIWGQFLWDFVRL